jgi:hypothetical protein
LNNIKAENLPNLKKGRDFQVKEASRTPNWKDQERNTPRHNITKTLQYTQKKKLPKGKTTEKQTTDPGWAPLPTHV